MVAFLEHLRKTKSADISAPTADIKGNQKKLTKAVWAQNWLCGYFSLSLDCVILFGDCALSRANAQIAKSRA